MRPPRYGPIIRQRSSWYAAAGTGAAPIRAISSAISLTTSGAEGFLVWVEALTMPGFGTTARTQSG